MRKLGIFFVLFISVFLFKPAVDVYAKTMNPRYATINNNYLYSNFYMNTSYQITYNVYESGTAYLNFCISPALGEEKYNYAIIDICSNGSNTFSLTGGYGYALLDGSIDYINQSCTTTSGYKGFINRLYVQLIDWEIPPGGADFYWSCFQIGQTSIANYTSLNRLLNIQIKNENSYFDDFNQQSIVNSQTAINNNINNQTNAINNQTNAINNQTNAINNQTGVINNQTNTISDSTISTTSSSSFFSNFSTTDNGGISSVITAPLSFVRAMTNSCSPISFTIFEQEVSLPCGTTLFWDKEEVQPFRNVWNVLIGGAFVYMLLRKVFMTIEDMKDPESDKVSVIKL